MEVKSKNQPEYKVFSIQLNRLLISMVVTLKDSLLQEDKGKFSVAEINIKEDNRLDQGFIMEPEDEDPEVIHGAMTIENNSKTAQSMKVYQSEALFFSENGNGSSIPGKAATDPGLWITFEPQNFILKPRSERTIDFTVAIPQETKLQGNYWSKIVIKKMKNENPQENRKNNLDIMWS